MDKPGRSFPAVEERKKTSTPPVGGKGLGPQRVETVIHKNLPYGILFLQISCPLLQKRRRQRKRKEPVHEVFLRKSSSAVRHRHRRPGCLPQKLHSRSGGHPPGGRKRPAPDRLQPGDRNPHHRPRPDRTGRQSGPLRPAVRRDHPKTARRRGGLFCRRLYGPHLLRHEPLQYPGHRPGGLPRAAQCGG